MLIPTSIHPAGGRAHAEHAMHDMVELHMPLMAQRLDNWRRWCRVGRAASAVRCGSIESRFVPPSVMGRTDDDASRFIDRLDALQIERAMPWLHERDRLLIKAHYVLAQPEHISCRRFGIRLGADHYRHAVYRAAAALKNILDKRESGGYKANHNLIPSSGEFCARLGAQARQ